MSEQQIIRRGYKYRLRQNGAHEALYRRYAGCCRKVKNMALAEQQARRERGEKYASYVEMAKWLTQWRNDPETSYLKECPVHAEQMALKALDESFQKFFKGQGGYPKFTRRGQFEKFGESDVKCFEVDEANARVRLPKIGWVRYRKSRELDGTPKKVSVSLEANGWHISIQTERVQNLPLSESTAIAGGDRGIKNFIALDNGKIIKPLNAHKDALYKLRRYQRAIARKIEAAKVKAGIPKDKPFPKGFKLQKSNRLNKSLVRLSKHQAKIASMRNDYLHKVSTSLADDYAVFCLENLLVKNMSASAKGTEAEPGRNVRQKSGLNRSILDQGWFSFKVMLGYKLVERGGELILVPPQYTSQRCSCCGHTEAANRQDEKFRCLNCNFEDHADVNAAKNILAAGHAVLSGRNAGCAVVEDAVQQDRPVKRLPFQGASPC